MPRIASAVLVWIRAFQNTMDQRNFTYMFYGFAAAWLILALYVVSLVARGRKLSDQLETLKRTLSQEKG
jgi:CcmD family protein